MSDILRVVLMMTPSTGYEVGLFRGIAQYARHYSSWVFLPFWEQANMVTSLPYKIDLETLRSQKGRSKTKAMMQLFQRLEVTGIIGRLVAPEVVDAVLALNLPAIGMDPSDEQLADKRFIGGISGICPDSHKAGRMAAEHLLERGFRRFAFCGHQRRPNWSRLREEGFRERLQESGFECDVYEPQSKTSLPWQREYPTVVTWLQSLQKPVGVMACNDVRGRQIIEACALGKMHVPNDVAVIGVDEDIVLSELSNPPLSSIALNGERGGYQTAELLHKLMLGECQRGSQRILVEPLWVNARLSTDVFAIEDRDIAETVRYIRENAKRPIQISDIVNHSGISRRALEIRFHRNLGWSIREEIERIRIGFTKQLLAETDLPFWKVAENTGFNSEDYLRKVFRRTTHMTLARYRREHRAT